VAEAPEGLMRLALLFLALASGPVAADDLLGVYRLAQEHDPQWAAARASHQANVEKRDQGTAQLLPSLNLNASALQTNQDVRIGSATNRYNYRTDSYGLVLTQPLYRRSNLASARQGEAGARQAEQELHLARQDLILRSVETYLNLLLAEDNLEFATAEKTAIERLHKLAQRNFAVGNASLVDVHDAQAAFDLAVAQEIAARTEADARREAMRALIGRSPGALQRLVRQLPLDPPAPADPDQWAKQAREANPQIKAAEEALAVARAEVDKNRGGHQPTLDLTASHTYTDAGGSLQGFASESTTNQVGLVFQWPLYAGGQTSSRVREAIARQEEARQRLEAARRGSDQQTRNAYLDVLTGIARLRALELALASNRRALETTLIGYERGQRNGQDVLTNQRNVLRTQRDLSQARYQYLLARLRLKAAVGTLVDDDLTALNRLLAPAPGS
jgi:outer membrane protein